MPPEGTEVGWRYAAALLDMKLAAEDALAFVAGLDGAAFLASIRHQGAVIRKLESAFCEARSGVEECSQVWQVS